MKKIAFFFLLVLVVSFIGNAQNNKSNISSNLFGNPPDPSKKNFAKGIVSFLDSQINTSEYNETCPSLSPDEKYIFFSRITTQIKRVISIG